MLDTSYKHRKGSKTLILLNKDGSPLKNQDLEVKQVKHVFLFGCSEFDCIPYINGYMDQRQEDLTREMFDKFFKLFNFVTLPFYWAQFEANKDQPRTEQMKKAALWFKEKGLTLKGHPLSWHTLAPKWLLDMDNDQILDRQLDRIERDVTEFKGIVDMWDVINEPVIMPIFDKYDNGLTRICKELGRIDLIRKLFIKTREANEKATLLINDFDTSIAYEILIEGCLESGIKIDEIGIQSHMHQGYWGVEKTQRVLERFSRFNLPIHFTENTIISGQIMPAHIVDLNDYQVSEWPSTPQDEDRQAQELVSHYKTLFAHPLVKSITWWDFVDGKWLGAPSGLLRKDMTAKPAFDELDKLINKQWWTGPTRLATDEKGAAHVEGYLGSYELRVNDKTVSFNLDKDSPVETLVI